MILGDGVEDNLGVALQVGDGYTLAVLNEVVATEPGHLRCGLAKDWNVELQSVLGVHLHISEGLGVNVREHWMEKMKILLRGEATLGYLQSASLAIFGLEATLGSDLPALLMAMTLN